MRVWVDSEYGVTMVECPKCQTPTSVEPWDYNLPALCPECNYSIDPVDFKKKPSTPTARPVPNKTFTDKTGYARAKGKPTVVSCLCWVSKDLCPLHSKVLK